MFRGLSGSGLEMEMMTKKITVPLRPKKEVSSEYCAFCGMKILRNYKLIHGEYFHVNCVNGRSEVAS